MVEVVQRVIVEPRNDLVVGWKRPGSRMTVTKSLPQTESLCEAPSWAACSRAAAAKMLFQGR